MGLLSAIAFLAYIRLKPERELQTLAIGLIIAALIYVDFAIVGKSSQAWIAIKLAGIGIYSVPTVMGLRYSTW